MRIVGAPSVQGLTMVPPSSCCGHGRTARVALVRRQAATSTGPLSFWHDTMLSTGPAS